MKSKQLIISLFAAASLFLAACSADETDLGLELQDPTTSYAGQRFTLTADYAMSVRDDSLSTTGYSLGVVGNYSDTAFGSVSSVLYTQVALPNITGITFDEQTVIDSVVLYFVTGGFFPTKADGYDLHFDVFQLAEAVNSDSNYVATDELPATTTSLYSATQHYTMADSIIALRLNDNILPLLQGTHTEDAFLASMKGLRVSIDPATSTPCMVTVNWLATNTCMRVYYHYESAPDDSLTYELHTGAATHFTHFSHNYAGTTLGSDSVAGTSRLYLDPLGGYNVKVSFASAIENFHNQHPYATVHYAEMLLPLAADSDANRPDRILALRYAADGSVVSVTDMMDTYLYAGYDGGFDTVRNCYRLRLTTQVQGLLREGTDLGLLLTLNSRRHAAQRAIVNGPATADPIRLEIVYTE